LLGWHFMQMASISGNRLPVPPLPHFMKKWGTLTRKHGLIPCLPWYCRQGGNPDPTGLSRHSVIHTANALKCSRPCSFYVMEGYIKHL
jgi:hypothetical protein